MKSQAPNCLRGQFGSPLIPGDWRLKSDLDPDPGPLTPAADLDTPRSPRILSMEAHFLESGRNVRRSTAHIQDAEFQRKALSNRKQTAVGLQSGVAREGNSLPGGVSRTLLPPPGPDRMVVLASLDRSRRQILRVAGKQPETPVPRWAWVFFAAQGGQGTVWG